MSVCTAARSRLVASSMSSCSPKSVDGFKNACNGHGGRLFNWFRSPPMRQACTLRSHTASWALIYELVWPAASVDHQEWSSSRGRHPLLDRLTARSTTVTGLIGRYTTSHTEELTHRMWRSPARFLMLYTPQRSWKCPNAWTLHHGSHAAAA